MTTPIESLLLKYKLHTPTEYENALKEIIQEITLAGLARAEFFNRAAFYGGTALRIFYGLPRFSEDLDFTLLQTQKDFKLQPYFSSVVQTIESFGFNIEIKELEKSVDRTIESAFLKANTKIHLLKISSAQRLVQSVPANKIMTVKFEVDTSPALGFITEVKPLLPPISASIKILKPSSLFAGKMHAVLFRKWKLRVKGRDFYDLLWFIGQRVPLKLSYLKQKMIDSGQWIPEEPLTKERLVKLLEERFNAVEWENAKDDLVRFLNNPEEIKDWSAEFFLSALALLQVES